MALRTLTTWLWDFLENPRIYIILLQLWITVPPSLSFLPFARTFTTMELDSTLIALTTGALILSWYLKKNNGGPLSHLPLPPGPKGLPLIGNLRDMPTSFEWKTYHKWCKEFGTLARFYIFLLESESPSDVKYLVQILISSLSMLPERPSLCWIRTKLLQSFLRKNRLSIQTG